MRVLWNVIFIDKGSLLVSEVYKSAGRVTRRFLALRLLAEGAETARY